MKASARARARARARVKARAAEPGRAEWKAPLYGRCASCGWRGRLIRHHVCYEQHVRREGGDPWDLRNAMPLGTGCSCHANHHSAFRRLRAALIPAAAIDFMNELLGSGRAADYVARLYKPDE